MAAAAGMSASQAAPPATRATAAAAMADPCGVSQLASIASNPLEGIRAEAT
jgi:hypothetical protein